MGQQIIRATLATCALLLASCGPKTLVLPEEPVDRAATCGAVAAASGRRATDVAKPLSLEAIGRVIHYPLLAGSTGESFSSDTATAVQARMSEIQDSVGEGKWQELIPACRAAFPATAVEKVTLPADRFEAQLGCYELGDFLRSSLEEQEEYVNELGEYRQLGYKLDPALTARLSTRAGSAGGSREVRRKALATMAKAGPPVTVMRECVARFG
jgi:hypothetical protein